MRTPLDGVDMGDIPPHYEYLAGGKQMDAVLAKKMVGSVFGGESGALIAPKMENLWRHANSTRNGAIDGNRMGLSDFLEILHGLVQPADAFEEAV